MSAFREEVVNLDRLDTDAIVEVDPLDLLFARGNMGHIDEVVVAGRTVAKDGKVTGVDLPAWSGSWPAGIARVWRPTRTFSKPGQPCRHNSPAGSEPTRAVTDRECVRGS